MENEKTPNVGSYDPYDPKLPEELESLIITSVDDLPPGYKLLYQEDRILEPTPDGRTRLDVLITEHGHNLRLMPVSGGYLIYKFMGLKSV